MHFTFTQLFQCYQLLQIILSAVLCISHLPTFFRVMNLFSPLCTFSSCILSICVSLSVTLSTSISDFSSFNCSWRFLLFFMYSSLKTYTLHFTTSPIRLCNHLDCSSICLLPRLSKQYCVDLHQIFTVGMSSFNRKPIQF